MNQRCFNPKCAAFPGYGGRGITVCPEWRTFDGFFASMGDRPGESYSIGRINNDGNYEPGNCRWELPIQQSANLRSNRYIELNGESLHVSDWARRLGVRPSTITNRLRRGWPAEKALTGPPMSKRMDLKVEFAGEALSVKEWAAKTGMRAGTIHRRLALGWPIERVFTAPLKATRIPR